MALEILPESFMANKKRLVDLHTHSNASDGSDSPAELVKKAAGAGLAAVALTDHDSLAGLDEAEEAASKYSIRFVRGIEIAVKDDFGELHIVGLWLPRVPSSRMLGALEQLQQNRRERNLHMLEVITGLGMPLDIEEVRAVSGGGAIGRPHIALAMKKKGYVLDRKEAFDKYLGYRKKAYVPRILMTPEEGIGLLRDEGATVVLAHPCLAPTMTEQRLDATLNAFRSYGLNAVEAYHSAHAQEKVRLCVELAAKHKLLLSGGSDYHGDNKEGIDIGRGMGGNVRIPVHVLEKLERFRSDKGLSV